MYSLYKILFYYISVKITSKWSELSHKIVYELHVISFFFFLSKLIWGIFFYTVAFIMGFGNEKAHLFCLPEIAGH
jgi:hypothetical protein